MEIRRQQGVKPRSEYVKEQKDKTDDKLFELRQLLEENPNEKRPLLAKKLGIGRTRLYELLKHL